MQIFSTWKRAATQQIYTTVVCYIYPSLFLLERYLPGIDQDSYTV